MILVRPFFVCAKNGRQKSAEKDKLKRLSEATIFQPVPASRFQTYLFRFKNVWL